MMLCVRELVRNLLRKEWSREAEATIREVDQTKQAEAGSLEGIRPKLEQRHEDWSTWMKELCARWTAQLRSRGGCG